MHIQIDARKRPVKSKVRRYPAPQRAFLNKYVDKLVEFGFFIPNANATWQAAPLLVPKPSKATFRATIDLRPVNAATTPSAWPMPNIDAELQDFSGSTCFACLDFCSGYWQLPVHPDSYSACGVVCPNGTYSSTRVLQGLKNAVSHFQSTVEPLFAELRNNMKAWLDDFPLHAKTEEELLNLLQRFFEICKDRNLFLSASKCTLFSKEIKWCGRVISKNGYKIDPRNAEALKDLKLPNTADELCEFVHCCRWMAMSIPAFAIRSAPLTKVLEEAYAKVGRRTKRSIKKINLRDLSWGPKQKRAYEDIQQSLRTAVELAHPKPDNVICIHTDASDRFWAAVVSQTMPEELNKPRDQQRHEPLAFLGSELTGSELNWTTFEKEGYAIFMVFEKLDYMLMGGQPIHVFTDHRNLLFVFSPHALEPTIGRHVISKVQRWAMYLSKFDYSIEHVEGSQNTFADMLTRWAKGYRYGSISTSQICALYETGDQIVPSSEEIIWPTMSTMKQSQIAENENPRGYTVGEDGLIRVKERIWIPESDANLQLKILVVSHCGGQGHRGASATLSMISENFYWKNMEYDIETFVKSCIHCITTRTGDMIPRPLSMSLHASHPNEVLHIDYLYMGESTDSLKYILAMRDDLSSFVWLWPTEAATSEAAADALTSWIATFGSITWLISDRGPHFANNLIDNMTKQLHIDHHFTTAYSPWANGSIERVCREILRACGALLQEFRLSPKDWPAVTECMQSILNQSPLKRLGLRDAKKNGVFRTPLEVFTSHRPKRPLLQALPIQKFQSTPNLHETRARQVILIDEVQSSLEGMHREVFNKADQSRKRSIAMHNAKTNVQPINFGIGDFVLIRSVKKQMHKLGFTWTGPKRVIEAKNDLVFVVQDLVKQKKETVHSRRMLLYRADMDGTDVDEALLKYAEHSEAQFQTARSLNDIRSNDNGTEVEIEWEGLPDTVDRTWEPVEQIHQDLPGMLEDFLHTAKKRQLKQKTLAELF